MASPGGQSRRPRGRRSVARGVVKVRLDAHPDDAAAVPRSLVERGGRARQYGNDDGETGRTYLTLLLPGANTSQGPGGRKEIGQ